MKTKTTKVPAAASPAPGITQTMLAEYKELCQQERVREERRQCLIALLRSGAAVEKGSLTAKLSEHERIVCSWEKLDVLLGPDEVDDLRSQIEPTVITRLVVAPRPGKGGTG